MSVGGKGQLKAREQQAIWEAFDKFLIASLNDCITRMSAANTVLHSHAKKISVQSLGREDAVNIIDGITSAANLDEEKLKAVAVMVKGDGNSDPFAKLLGLINHSTLLQKQLANVVAVVGKVAGLDSMVNDRDIKQQFMKYGMDLSHIWRHCEEHCSTLMEKRILKAAMQPSAPVGQPQKKAS